MAATVVTINRKEIAGAPLRTRAKKAAPARQGPAPRILRAPKPETRYALRIAAKALLDEGYTLADQLAIARAYAIDVALQETKQNQTKAARRLGISRQHVNERRKTARAIANGEAQ